MLRIGVHTHAHIIAVCGEARAASAMVELLRSAGFPRAVTCESVSGAAEVVPDVLVLVGSEVDVRCGQAREVPALADVPILAAVAGMPLAESSAALAAGASDVICEPHSAAVLGARVRSLARSGADTRRARRWETIHRATCQVQEALADAGGGPEGLRAALAIAAAVLDFERASLIAHMDGSSRAYVIAATDDPTFSKFVLAMEKYPEVSRAIQSGEPLLIDDVETDPVTAPVASALEKKGIRSLAVFPVLWRRRCLGVVLLRRSRRGCDHLRDSLLGFARLLTGQLAAPLSHSRVLERLEEQNSHPLPRATYEAERRLRTVDSLSEHFEAAADGIVVLDDEGQILYLNRAAELVTGFTRDGLVGSCLLDLVDSGHREGLQEAIRRVLRGAKVGAFDLALNTIGQPIWLSVSTSTVLSPSGAVILCFRDVTAQRALERELRKTKDFLEKLIDSTVDAIVAADIRGEVILFNHGAERIYGYTSQDVIARIPVWRLYEEGVAKQVMRMLRSTSYGGRGRLEQMRREVLSKSGELVPVNMTASIIYDDGREVATVGIFSDLRDRIRIEQRLLRAQERLERSQKQAVIAELAGAAAHELNQPLTSISVLAELIKRQSPPDAPHNRQVATIIREAERMAAIVKNIGRITRPETMPYPGNTEILDLKKSSAGGEVAADASETGSADREPHDPQDRPKGGAP